MHQHPVLLLLVFTFSPPVKPLPNENITNVEIFSQVDLKNQFAQITNLVVFTNDGPGAVRTYHYAFNDTDSHSIVFHNHAGDTLQYEKIFSEDSRTYLKILLDEDVRNGEKYSLLCKIIYPEKIRPAYPTRQFDEDQLLKFENHARFYSKYHTKKSRLEYRFLNTRSFVEATERPSYITGNGSVGYVFENVPKLDSSFNEIVFINNKPLLVVKSIRRTIDVYHFGKITVEDDVVVENNGARLIGPYVSRLSNGQRKATTNWLTTHLPSSASGIKFFDALGINSATKVDSFWNYLTFSFQTRYPLLGGWKSSYILRYDVPLYEYVYSANGSFVLKIRAVDHVLDGTNIENAVVRVVLPEGSHVKKIVTGKLQLEKEEIGCPGGLCVRGRRILVLRGHDLFGDYIENIVVEYSLSSWYLLRAPLVLAAYCEAIFLTVIVFRRMQK